MSDHPRTTIRHAIKTRLATPATVDDELVYPTVAKAQVFDSFNRPWPDDPDEALKFYPAILINTDAESVTADQKNTPGMRRRTLSVDIYGIVAGSVKDELDKELDDLALEIEKSMNGFFTIGGNADSSFLTGTSIAIEQGGQLLMGVVKLSYDVNYWTRTVQKTGTPGTLPFTVFDDGG
jgi:hypothetical protein